VIGASDALVDAEVIQLLWTIYQRVGIANIQVRLSSIDDPEPRRAYIERLKEYYRPHLSRLSEDSQRRFDRNPLRLLDSKDERDQALKEAAPKLIDQLSEPAAAHHQVVRDALEGAGIPYITDPLLVRGLDYYNRTVFEIVPTDDERAQSTIGGGGRYDGLIEMLGGQPTPGIGFGSGIERIVLEMQRNGVECAETPVADVFIAHRAEGSHRVAFNLAVKLRRLQVPTLVGESGRSLKSQVRSADASGARIALVIGESELAAGTVVLKDLRDGGEQRTIELQRAADEVVSALRAN
jgi:histidyl-tRNA synthetase